jgi:hypothetical protein
MPTQVCLLAAIITLSLHVFTKALGWNGIEMGEAWGINLRETTECEITDPVGHPVMMMADSDRGNLDDGRTAGNQT